ncbi:hypothetical protein EYF80_010368 [Liparis tanakae]|uniref:Uncharacterized protein n=1 Tax=Liparis tanakae TaxID=230148 RepID=A0A4Z2IPG2_9TELE|nr:hypothetical protein EYF80_010368 [Liparis tanakae]
MKAGMILWKMESRSPKPFSPVQRALKFSAVLGTMWENSSTVMVPSGWPSAVTSKNTRGRFELGRQLLHFTVALLKNRGRDRRPSARGQLPSINTHRSSSSDELDSVEAFGRVEEDLEVADAALLPLAEAPVPSDSSRKKGHNGLKVWTIFILLNMSAVIVTLCSSFFLCSNPKRWLGNIPKDGVPPLPLFDGGQEAKEGKGKAARLIELLLLLWVYPAAYFRRLLELRVAAEHHAT